MGQGHLRWGEQAEQRPWVRKDFVVRNPKQASMTVEEVGRVGLGVGLAGAGLVTWAS